LWTTICPISGSGLSPTCCQPFCLSSLCLLKFPAEISSSLLPPSPVCLEHPAPSAECYFSVPCVLFSFFFFFTGQGVSPSRGLCWFIPGVALGIPCDAWCSPVGMPNVSQAGLELAFGGAGALLFSQCNVA
jgi:hypothetical protein